jgi:RNA methyltransferase, TrmH family
VTRDEVIHSRDNTLLKRIRQLQLSGSKGQKARMEHGQAVLDGIHLLQVWSGDVRLRSLITTKAFQTHHEINDLIKQHLERCPNTQVHWVDEELWSSISELDNAPQIMGLLALEHTKIDHKTITGDALVLDAIQDTGNVGTILRTALACNFQQIICTVGTAHVWSPKVLRAAMGAHRHLQFYEGWSINDVASNVEAPLLATAMLAKDDLYSIANTLKNPVAWVFGNEGQGVSHDLLAQAKQMRIPQNSKIDSLNVATATAVCLYETIRVRTAA